MRSFPVLVLALFTGVALSFPIADSDIWWHLAAGREILREGRWPILDMFCRSSIGTRWIDLHWGFQILALGIWKISGNVGLVLLRMILPFAALVVALGRRPSWPTALGGCLCIWILRTFVDVRPLLLSLLLLASIQWGVESGSRRGRVVAIAIGLVCQILLANVQGLFLLGPLLVLAFSLGAWMDGRHRDAAWLGFLCAGMLLASLVNPYGVHAFSLAGKLGTRIVPIPSNPFSREIPENAPLWSWLAEEPSRALPLLWLGLLAATHWRRDSWSQGRLVALAGWIALSLLAVRNLPLLCLGTAFCLDPTKKGPDNRFWTASAGAVVLTLAIHAGLQRRWDLGDSRLAPFRLPGDSSLAIVGASNRPVFHEIRAGGWLSWKLDRPGVCWADTRLVLHDSPFLSEYLDVVDRPEKFPAFARSWDFGYVLIPLVEFPRFHPLAAFLLGSSDWSVADCDGAWVLFRKREGSDALKSDEIPLNTISLAVKRRFHGNSRLEGIARGAVRSFLLEGGKVQLAQEWGATR